MSLIVWSGTRNCSCTQIWEQSIPSLSVRQQRIRTARIKVSLPGFGVVLICYYSVLPTSLYPQDQRLRGGIITGDQHRPIKTTFLPTCLPTYLLETTWQNNLEIHFSLVSRNWTGFWLPLIMSHIYCSLCSFWGESPCDTSPKLCPGQSHKNSTICARYTTKTGNLPSVKGSYSLGDGVSGKPKFNRSDSKRNCLERTLTNCFNLLSSARMKPRTLSILDKCSSTNYTPKPFPAFFLPYSTFKVHFKV